MRPPSQVAHAPVSNRGRIAVPQRFLSSDPSLGQGARHPVNARGFEAIDGYQIKRLAPAPTPGRRNISELTYRSPTAKLQVAAAATQAKVNDTTLYPWRVNAELRITVPGKSEIFLGTGWEVAPPLVET